MLRVLDVQNSGICELPDGFMKSFNLKFLNLKETSIGKLPKSIGRLCNLLTLDIRNTRIEAFPCGIAELQNLCHLLMFRDIEDENGWKLLHRTQVPFNITVLKNLQALHCVEVEGDLIRLIGSMTQLTKIGISNVKVADETDLCVAIQNMQLLQYLFVMACDENESLQMVALLSPPLYLRELTLAGKLERVPHWFCSLQSLTSLLLYSSCLEDDPLPHIAALSWLKILTLVSAYRGKFLRFNTGFLKLTHMDIICCLELNEIIIEMRVMPNLKFLKISSCLELKIVPMGIEHLDILELDVIDASMELKN